MITIETQCNASIKVIGVGGGGGNAINNMVAAELAGVRFIACNTDSQALENSHADEKLQLGEKLTNGLGAGADPEIGWKSAMESQGAIGHTMESTDMVFITAGLGGGTGTGGAPVIAQACRDLGILTVGVVTMPFTFEGARRKKHAEMGLEELKKSVDTLIVIPNDRLLDIAHENMSMLDAFQCADSILLQAVRGISDIIITPGLINVDFKDVRAIMLDGGLALMGQGFASGEGRALAAAQAAACSPLLDGVSIEGATGILVNISGGEDLTLREVNEAMSYIQSQAHPDANIIFGSVIDYEARDEVRITVIATGGAKQPSQRPAVQREVVMETVSQTARAQASTAPPVLPTVRNSFQVPAAQRRSVTRSAPAQPKPQFMAIQSEPEPVAESNELPSPPPIAIDPFPGQTESEFDTPAFLRRK